MREEINAPTASDDSSSRSPPRRGKGLLALCSSLILPGLGHFWAGMHRRGLVWFAVMAGLTLIELVVLINYRLLPALVVLAPVHIVAALAMLVDAFRCGRRSTRPMLGRPWLREGVSVAIVAALFWTSPAAWLAAVINNRYVEAFALQSNAMTPTLATGDRFLAYRRVPVKRWSLVVIDYPEVYGDARVATRLVGLPDERIEIVDGELHVNGAAVNRPAGVGPYTDMKYRGSNAELWNHIGIGCRGNPIQLGPDEYFVLGDNSPQAKDGRLWDAAAPSRQLGALPAENVRGVVTAIYWPPNRWSLFE